MTGRTLIHIIPSNRWGGLQRYALDICRHYLHQGWKVAALTRNAVAVDTPFAAEGIRLLHAPVAGFADIATAMTLARQLRATPEQDKTVIHVHRYRDAITATLARLLAKRSDVRIISTRHVVRKGKNNPFFRKLYRLVDAHIFVSDLCYNTFRRSAGNPIRLPDNSVYILRNSFNIPEPSPTATPPAGPLCAQYVGAIVKGKGLETLIDAMSLLRDLRLRLRICGTGDPDYLDTLRRRAMSRMVMDSIDWNLHPGPVPEICRDAHFGVMPSTDREACCMSSMAFMAAGKAQVATNNGAQNEYLSDAETALMVKPADARELADSMRRLAEDPRLRLKLGENANALYSRLLSWPHFVNSLDKIYQ